MKHQFLLALKKRIQIYQSSRILRIALLTDLREKDEEIQAKTETTASLEDDMIEALHVADRETDQESEDVALAAVIAAVLDPKIVKDNDAVEAEAKTVAIKAMARVRIERKRKMRSLSKSKFKN